MFQVIDFIVVIKKLELNESGINPFYINFNRYFFYIGYVYGSVFNYQIHFNYDYRYKWIDFLKQNYNIEINIPCINKEDLIQKIQFLLNTIYNFERNQIFI